MGAAIGCSLAGGRPFVDIMFNDFMTAASDQLFNHGAKIHFMSGGRHSVPLTVWTLAGAGTRWGAQHSQHLEGWFAQVPGIKLLSPSTSAATAAAVAAALNDPDPVVLLVDRSLLYTRIALPGDDASPWDPRVVQPGDDVTLVASGRLVHLGLEAAQASNLSVEVIDLQRLAPLDISVILRSLEKTSRLVIAQDEVAGGAMGAIIESAVYDAGFWQLDGPIRRVTSPNTPVPAAAELEDAYMVHSEDIVRGLRQAIEDQ